MGGVFGFGVGFACLDSLACYLLISVCYRLWFVFVYFVVYFDCWGCAPAGSGFVLVLSDF